MSELKPERLEETVHDDTELLIVPGGREAAFERCKAAWVTHWNNEHVKIGRPWGGECCINMAIDAVIGVSKRGAPEQQNEG